VRKAKPNQITSAESECECECESESTVYNQSGAEIREMQTIRWLKVPTNGPNHTVLATKANNQTKALAGQIEKYKQNDTQMQLNALLWLLPP